MHHAEAVMDPQFLRPWVFYFSLVLHWQVIAKKIDVLFLFLSLVSSSKYFLDKDDDDSSERDRKDRKDDRKSSKERSSKDKVSCSFIRKTVF